MMWRSADGGLTLAFWWAAALSTAGIGAGIWGLVAPESLRFHYFRALNSRRSESGRRLLTPAHALRWSSALQIPIVGPLTLALVTAFMTWLLFFTTPCLASGARELRRTPTRPQSLDAEPC